MYQRILLVRVLHSMEDGRLINKVEICGVDTSKLPTIPEKQVVSYFERMKQGDKKSREEFIRGNLRLVLSVIKRFNNRGENLDDLFQIGCIGLIKAIDNFKLEVEVKFSTYAVPMIIGEIRRYLRDNNQIRVSRSLRDTAYKALQVRNKLAATKSEEPTIEEIAKELKMDTADISFALDAIQDPISLFEPVYHDGADAIFVMDQLKDSRSEDEVWLDGIALKEIVDKLGDRERQIINLRFYQGKTQTEVASEVGISQAQVSRLEKSAINNIKKGYQ